MLNAFLQLVLLPVLLEQGVWVAFRVQRFPEAIGPKSGVVGSGPQLKLLIVGDSSSVGVGVATQNDALAGHVTRELSKKFTVSWRVIGRNGATTRGLLRDLTDAAGEDFDAAVVALGVNDVKNGVPLWLWRGHYASLVSCLKRRFGVRHIVASGLPPFGSLKLLPQPLRFVLGRRSTAFDAALATLASGTDTLTHLPFDGSLEPSYLADDGMHPSPALYAIWAKRVGAAILAHWASAAP